MSGSDLFLAPISIGEAYDKVTILNIKEKMINDDEKKSNVLTELRILNDRLQSHIGAAAPALQALIDQLQDVNMKLWQIEDDIRDCERNNEFGQDFIELARSVYVTNDERAKLKKKINILVGSRLIEEKSYSDYLTTGS